MLTPLLGSAGVLRRLIAGGNLTHEALDDEANRAAAGFLRALLVFTEVLPPRNSELEEPRVACSSTPEPATPEPDDRAPIRGLARPTTSETTSTPPGDPPPRTRTAAPCDEAHGLARIRGGATQLPVTGRVRSLARLRTTRSSRDP